MKVIMFMEELGSGYTPHLRFSSHFYILKNTTLFSLQKLPLNNKSEMSKTHYKVKSQLNNISYLNMYIKL